MLIVIMAGGCVTIIIVQRGTLFLLVVWHDRTRSFVSWIRFSRGPWTSSIRCLDTFISFQNFSKRITHIYVYSQGCFRNVSRIERRFSFLFLEMRFVFDNSIVQASSKYSSCLLAVTIGGNLDEPRLSKPVFHWTVPAYRSWYNCSKANIRD